MKVRVPVAANPRALRFLQRPATHAALLPHSQWPSNCIAYNLLHLHFVISPLFRLFALRRFAEGQGGGHVQLATARTAPSLSLSRTRFRTQLQCYMLALVSTSDALKELLSSIHHASFHVHACMFACSCYMHVSSLIDVVWDQ